MSRPRHRLNGPAALNVIEEAVHLLRLAPAKVLATYYLGALPFALGLLYFWADMSRGAFAWKHCAEASLGLAVLYLWMKCWQAVFARQLLARLTGQPAPRWTPTRIAQLVTAQTLIQPTGLLVLPVMMAITLPFGWMYAFYHNLSVFGSGDTDELGQVVRKSWRQAGLWAGQNHVVFSILWLFGLFVFVNLFAGVVLVPLLLKSFLGLETAFTMSLRSLMNTTFFAAIGCLTYLCLNPLIKAAYVLRCFYGESLQTGADLKADLRAFLPAAALVLLLLIAPPALATESAPAPVNRELPAQLDHSIDQVINQPEYTWRLPREKQPIADEDKGFIVRVLDSLVETMRGWFRSIQRLLRKFAMWLDEWMREHLKSNRGEERSSGDWLGALHTLFFIVVAAVVASLAFLFWRVWKQRQRRRAVAVAEPALPAVDLSDENVIADQLPADGWLAKARELMAAGDLRLALRALYLASLAHLGQRELIVISRSKSNHEYERELRRRAQSRAELLAAFGENVTTFESAWYGMHEVTGDILDRFNANFDRIREGS